MNGGLFDAPDRRIGRACSKQILAGEHRWHASNSTQRTLCGVVDKTSLTTADAGKCQAPKTVGSAACD